MGELQYKLYKGDCLDVLAALEGNSIDTCITDPPYGLDFQGKNWDYGVPSALYWKEVLRVLKPGSMLLAFGGSRTHHRLMTAIEDSGFELRDTIAWLYAQGLPKSYNLKRETKDPIWNDYGTALKPAIELIIVAMKPIEGTFVENAQKWGVAGFNIEAGRIRANYSSSERRTSKPGGGRGGMFFPNGDMPAGERHNPAGRFPANLVLSHSEECGKECHPQCPVRQINNQSEGSSRFFYVSKARKREKNLGLPSWLTNNHPTVKPLALCQYLARLTKTPTGGIVLDPFCGSGSIGVASILEGRNFIGIDIDEDPKVPALEIAEYRLEWALEQVNAVSTPVQED